MPDYSHTIAGPVRPGDRRSALIPTTGGKTAFGLFYPPHNPDYVGPAIEKPPLLVKGHGGPTGAACWFSPRRERAIQACPA
jgi:hypothetical protein